MRFINSQQNKNIIAALDRNVVAITHLASREYWSRDRSNKERRTAIVPQHVVPESNVGLAPNLDSVSAGTP